MEHLLDYLWYGPKEKLRFLWVHRIKKVVRRLRHGCWPDECWNLDVTFAKFILPRLKYFKDHNHGYPADLTEETWNHYLSEMIIAFKYIDNEGYYDCPEKADGTVDAEALQQQIDETQHGLELFAKYYMGLWN